MQTQAADPLEDFERAWSRATPEPDWTTFLPADLNDWPLMRLEYLIRADIEYRIKRGRPAILQERYWERSPLAESKRFREADCVELIRSEVLLRHKLDDRAAIDEYADAFPSLATAIRTQLANLKDTAADSAFEKYSRAREITESPQPESPPEIPGFEILGKIDAGGMGIIWRARDLAIDRLVAVKLLKSRYAKDKNHVARLLKEARITGQLQHPGIPPVHHVGQLPDGRPYFVMKLIEGESLADLIDRHGTYAKLDVFEEIAQAVGYAHAHNTIHRDLKPSNVMVGAFGEIQVMDWGLAKLLGDPEADEEPGPRLGPVGETGAHDETRAGSVLGTISFMPPEQAVGAVNLMNERTDVFGLGAILCMMLTGQPPYKAAGAEATRQLAAMGKLDDAYGRLAKCGADPALVELCRKCLHAEPRKRLGSGAQVAMAIARMKSDAAEALRRNELETVRRQERRRSAKRLLITIIASAVILIAVAAIKWR